MAADPWEVVSVTPSDVPLPVTSQVSFAPGSDVPTPPGAPLPETDPWAVVGFEEAPSPPSRGMANDFAAGFNQRVADLIGAPVELVDRGLRLAGMSLLERPGDAQRAVRDAFDSVGISTQAADTLASKVGKDFLEGSLVLLGLGAAAPALSAGTGAVSRAFGQMGEQVVAQPGLAVAAELGGSAGAHAAGEVSDSPVARMAGGFAGGGLAVGAAAGVRDVATGAVGAARQAIAGAPESDLLPGAIRRAVGPAVETARAPLRQEVSAGVAQEAVRERLGRRGAAYEALEKRIMERYQQETPEDVSQRFMREIEAARTSAKALETTAWNDVPGSVKAPVVNTMGKLEELVANTPTAQKRDIPNYMRTLLPRDGASIRAMSAKELQGYRSRMLDEARLPSTRSNAKRIREQLADAILADIESAPVDNKAYEEARALTTRVNDFFTRGPIGDVLRRQREGDLAVSPRVALGRVMTDPEGIPQVRRLAQEGPRPQLMQDMDAAVRADFGVTGRAPTGAAGRRTAQELPKVVAEVTDAAELVARTQSRAREFETGALARFVEGDPQIAVKQLLDSTNPARDAAQLVRTLRSDREALQGLRSGVLEELWRRSGDGTRLRQLIEEPRFARTLDVVLSDAERGRLRRMVTAADDVAQAQTEGVRTVAFPVTRILGRFIGAQTGRVLAGVTGGGTVQTPGIFSGLAAQTVDRMFQTIPAEELLARAIVDPRWERILMARMPASPREARNFARTVNRLLAQDAALRTGTED